jgi:hypothetical protein
MKMSMHSETSTIYDVAKNKLNSDVQLENAKAALYRFSGIGALVAMAGLGIGIACFGYSYVTDGRGQAEKMADAMVQALEKAQLTTVGEVRLADGSTVALASGGQVSIDPNSVVRVESSSTGSPALFGKQGFGTTATPATTETSPESQHRVVTQYTTFKTVVFGTGHVVTGWNFDDSNQLTPSRQYCYYDEPGLGDTHVRTDLGDNGLIRVSLDPHVSIDVQTAFRSCSWFSSANRSN